METVPTNNLSYGAGLDEQLVAIVAELAVQEATYLRRRRLADGPNAHAALFASDLARNVQTDYSADVVSALVPWTALSPAMLRRSQRVSASRLVAVTLGTPTQVSKAAE